jgi:hypothetical protein
MGYSGIYLHILSRESIRESPLPDVVLVRSKPQFADLIARREIKFQ